MVYARQTSQFVALLVVIHLYMIATVFINRNAIHSLPIPRPGGRRNKLCARRRMKNTMKDENDGHSMVLRQPRGSVSRRHVIPVFLANNGFTRRFRLPGRS